MFFHLTTTSNFRVFKVGMKLEVFYDLLVKELNTNETNNPADTLIFVEKRKKVIEISQTFHGKSDFFHSCVWRTVIDHISDLLMLSWLCINALRETLEVSYKYCKIE